MRNTEPGRGLGRVRRALIVGQAPQRSAYLDPRGPFTLANLRPGWRPWSSDSGHRLATMMGTSLEEMLETCDTVNLNQNLRGLNGKYDVFNKGEARTRAEALMVSGLAPEARRLSEYDVVLCCGAEVAGVMGLSLCSAQFVSVGESRPPSMRLAIPHPGGTNRWWNSPESRALGRATVGLFWAVARGSVWAPPSTPAVVDVGLAWTPLGQSR